MKCQNILNYVLLLSLFSGTSLAISFNLGYTSYDRNDTIVERGIGYTSTQSVDGIGFTSVHSSINADPEVLQTHSSGSGSYKYNSTINLLNFTSDDLDCSYIAAERSVRLQEGTSFNYSPCLLYEGTFRSGPIKSLWSDSITTGNSEGAFMKVGFDNTRVLSKNVHTKVSGFVLGSSGLLDIGMKFDAAFTGNENLGVSLIEPNKKTPTKLMDEYYSGTYRMSKNLGITIDNLRWDYGEKSDDWRAINWLPCCLGGYSDMDLTDQRYHSAKDFFDYNSCEPPKPCSNVSLPRDYPPNN